MLSMKPCVPVQAPILPVPAVMNITDISTRPESIVAALVMDESIALSSNDPV
jgi:hypothetical protein